MAAVVWCAGLIEPDIFEVSYFSVAERQSFVAESLCDLFLRLESYQ